MALEGAGSSLDLGESFMDLKMCGKGSHSCNLGTMLGKQTERMEWQQFEI